MDIDTTGDELYETAREELITVEMNSFSENSPLTPITINASDQQFSFNVGVENIMEISKEVALDSETSASKYIYSNLERTSTPNLVTEVDFNLNQHRLAAPMTVQNTKMPSVSEVSHILPPSAMPQLVITPATPPSLKQRSRYEELDSLNLYVSRDLNLTSNTSLRESIDVSQIVVLIYQEITLSVKYQRSLKDSIMNFWQNSSNTTSEKNILHGLSGMFASGLNVIMGPSGSGKTSFLDVLSGRLGSNYHIGGTVSINGHKFQPNFRSFLGYASQDDILNSQLTVSENIRFSICLRRKCYTSEQEQKVILRELLTDLNLLSCADTKVGLVTDHNISGGERKRTAVAMELASGPKMLFLDEPTSKLDSSSSKHLVTALKKFAHNGRTIIMTIHQPSFALYKMFDTLTLLARGRTIYHGDSGTALKYFSQLGYSCDIYDSPPDYFLDILFGLIKRKDIQSLINEIPKTPRHNPSSISLRHQVLKKSLQNSIHVQQIQNPKDDVFSKSPEETRLQVPIKIEQDYSAELDITTTEGAKQHKDVVETLSNEYLDSQLNVLNRQKLDQFLHINNLDLAKCPSHDYPRDMTSYLLEYYHLSHRVFLSTKQLFLLVIVMNIVIGLLFGVLYYHSSPSEPPSIQNTLGLFFNLSIYALMVPAMMTAKNFVITEKALFNHERKSRFYIVSIYFLVRCSIVLICRIFSAIILSILVYWMTGLKRSGTKFLYFLLTTFCSGIACDALCLLTATAFKSFDNGRNLLVLYMTITSVFSGYLMNLGTALPILAWLKYLSFTRYCYVGWVINEFREHKSSPCPLMNTPERLEHAQLIRSRLSDTANLVTEKCTYYPSDVVLPQAVGNDSFLLDYSWLNETILIGMAICLFYACFHCMKRI